MDECWPRSDVDLRSSLCQVWGPLPHPSGWDFPSVFQQRVPHLLPGGSSLKIIQFSDLPGISILARETYSSDPGPAPFPYTQSFWSHCHSWKAWRKNQPHAQTVSSADFPNSRSQVQAQSSSQGSVCALRTPRMRVPDEEWMRRWGFPNSWEVVPLLVLHSPEQTPVIFIHWVTDLKASNPPPPVKSSTILQA